MYKQGGSMRAIIIFILVISANSIANIKTDNHSLQCNNICSDKNYFQFPEKLENQMLNRGKISFAFDSNMAHNQIPTIENYSNSMYIINPRELYSGRDYDSSSVVDSIRITKENGDVELKTYTYDSDGNRTSLLSENVFGNHRVNNVKSNCTYNSSGESTSCF